MASAAASAIACRRLTQRHPPRGRILQTPSGALHVWEQGPSRPRATVLLLHGASGNLSDMTLSLAPALVDRYRVIAVDRPGHGWSERRNGAADACPSRQARIIIDALRSIGAGPMIVLGHSWAGALAACFALEHREMTRAIVLVSAATHPWPGGISWYYRYALDPLISPLFTRTIVAPAVMARMRFAVRGVFAPQQPPPEYVERIGAELIMTPARFLANAQDMQALLDYVSANHHRYPEIETTTRIITGDADTVVPDQHSRAFHDKVRGSSLTILPGVGHMPHHVAVDAVAREVDAAVG